MWHYLNYRTVYVWPPSLALAPGPGPPSLCHTTSGEGTPLRHIEKAKTGPLALNNDFFLNDSVFSKTKIATYFPAINSARIVNTSVLQR